MLFRAWLNIEVSGLLLLLLGVSSEAKELLLSAFFFLEMNLNANVSIPFQGSK